MNLPVIDNHRLVDVVREADILRRLPEHAIAVKAICSQQATTSRRFMHAADLVHAMAEGDDDRADRSVVVG